MSEVTGSSRAAGALRQWRLLQQPQLTVRTMEVAGPVSSLVPASTLFFSLPVDSVSDPIPSQEMVFPLKLTIVCFCCLQPKLSLIGVECLGRMENQKASGML